MGSSPASLDSWPGDGSTTSGVPKKLRTWGQAAGILIGGLPGRNNGLSAQQVRRAGSEEIPQPPSNGFEPAAGPCSSWVSPMTEVTRILSAIEQGDPNAAGELLPLVYDELRKLAAHKMAQEAAGQTLQPTALVHEAYLRLVGAEHEAHWDSRGHFFAAAAEAMRRILVENARRKRSRKHGGGLVRHDVDDVPLAAPEFGED